MGLFDKLKDAAGGLVEGAKNKVNDVTGVDTDQLLDAAGSFVDAGDSVSDGVDALSGDAKAE